MRVTLLGMAASGALATIKLVAGLVGNSYALVADSIESFGDIASAAIVWGGLAISAKPPDDNHPYGHGKAEPIAGLTVGFLLVAAAVGICSEALHQMGEPQTPPASFTLVVLILVVFVKEALYRLASRVGGDIESVAVQADAWHHRSDALTSLIAAVGISVSLWGGPAYAAADDWAAVAASVVIAFNGIRFIHLAGSELMDVQPPEKVLTEIEAAAKSVGGVQRVEKTLARKVGSSYFVDMHVEVDGRLTVKEGHNLAHDVKDAVQANDPRVADVLVHVEPYEPDAAVTR
jgi:cation diffusion facilitator family transporter